MFVSVVSSDSVIPQNTELNLTLIICQNIQESGRPALRRGGGGGGYIMPFFFLIRKYIDTLFMSISPLSLSAILRFTPLSSITISLSTYLHIFPFCASLITSSFFFILLKSFLSLFSFTSSLLPLSFSLPSLVSTSSLFPLTHSLFHIFLSSSSCFSSLPSPSPRQIYLNSLE